jgi:hypothetical protein
MEYPHGRALDVHKQAKREEEHLVQTLIHIF